MSALPPRVVRAVGRWFMNGRFRRHIFSFVNNATRSGSGRIRRGPMAGLVFAGGDTGGYLLGASEPAVQQLLVDNLAPGDTFYDIGANVGYLSLLGCKLVGPQGHVHCFEPLAPNTTQLAGNLASNGFKNFTVHEVALADEGGTVQILHEDVLGRARLLPSDAPHAATASRKVVEVRAARLDDLNLPPPTLVKIDVEGAESRVLEGMRATLRRYRPVVVVEIHDEQREPVLDLLEQTGFQTATINEDGMPHVIARPVEHVVGP